MKLTKIELRDYRNHQATTVELGHVTVFYGDNGDGKSSILSAPETVLVGRNEWTDRLQLLDLIRTGAKKAEITLHGRNQVTKVIRETGSQLKVGTTVITQERLLESLGTSAQVVSALCRSPRFLSLEQGEQQDVLFGLLGFNMTIESVIGEVEKWCARAGDKIVLAKMLLAENGEVPVVGGLAGFDKIAEIAVKARRRAGREVDRLSKLNEAAWAEVGKAAALEWTKEMAEEMKSLENRRDGLAKDIGAADSAKHLLQNLERECARLVREIEDAKKVLSGYNAETSTKLRDQIARLTKIVNESNAELDRLRTKTAGLKAERDQIVSSVNGAKGKTGDFSCPVFAIACPASGETRQKSLQFMLDRQNDLNMQIIEAGSQESKLEQVAKKADQDANFIQAELNRHIAVEPEKVKAKITQLESELEKARSQMSAVKSIPDVARLEETLGTVQESIRDLESKRQAVAMVEKTREKAGEIKTSLEKVEMEHRVWDLVARATDPDGAKAELVKTKLASLEERLNQRLGWLSNGEWQIWLLTEGKYNLRVLRRQSGSMRAVGSLSKSEERMLQLAVQDALAQLSGLKLLVIDELELFGDKFFAMFCLFLDKVRADYDTVLIAMTMAHGVVRDVPGSRQYLVENGSVKELNKAASASA